MGKPRVLLLDLETINLRADLSPILCIAYKWIGSKKVECKGLWDFPDYKNSPFDDKALCRFMYPILASADAWVAHFGLGFDFKFIKSRMLYNGLTPLPPVKMLDTWKVAKDNLLLTGNRLKGLAKFMKLKEQKGDPGGWDTWLKVVNGDRSAINKMVRYNKQDVRCLEGVFHELRPWMKAQPNAQLATGDRGACPVCGEHHLILQGKGINRQGVHSRFQCRSCGSWSTARENTKGEIVITHRVESGGIQMRSKPR